MQLLDDALEQTHARLVVIDPLMAFLDPAVHVTSDPSVRAALGPVKALAERHGCTILFIRHRNQSLRTRAMYPGLASIGFTGLCRSSWLAGPDPEQPERQVFAQIKNNPVSAQPSLAYQIIRQDGEQPALTWLGTSSHHLELLCGHRPRQLPPLHIEFAIHLAFVEYRYRPGCASSSACRIRSKSACI
ncbi:MAG TPA: AAA family ATPase [Gemmataceae bacterium]|nr:AAA family ATPase [Gemmataceae bacterium]